ncbi:MAG: NAD kinase, partial [Rhodospirillaceae bacterium]
MDISRIAFVASDNPEAQGALVRLRHRYGGVPADQASVVVALGGDGFMLETMHRYMKGKLPIYGMNRGTVGFLMNQFNEDGLEERLSNATTVKLRPLRMNATTVHGELVKALAFNEVSMLRETRQAAKLKISVDGKERLDEMTCDGVLVCTPAGSTAYNASAHGPILPIGSSVMALTPISTF